MKSLKHFRSLDIGDCQLTDKCVGSIKEIIHKRDNQSGLSELIISSNRKITTYGWSKILLAVAATSDMKYFHVDYNSLDDSCGYLIVAILSSNRALEVLDLECTGITNKTALLLLYLLKNYKINKLKCLNLLNNPIDASVTLEIKKYVKNEYDFETTYTNDLDMAAQVDSRTKTKPSDKKIILKKQNENKANELSDLNAKLNEQLKLEEYLNKANKFNDLKEGINDHRSQRIKYQQELDRLEYQRALEREYSLSKARYERWNSNNKFIKEKMSSPKKDEDFDTSELLKPYDDLRFKTHTVLPFNIVRY